MNVVIPFAAFFLAAGLMFLCNWLALKPWRESNDKHWSEQARLSFPALAAARSNHFTVPAIFTLIVLLVWPDSSPLWFFTGAAGYLGASLGILPATREIYPRIRLRELLEQFLVRILLRSPMWFLLIMPVIFMPDEPNGFTFIFGMFAIAIGLVWIRFGAWMARKISFVRPAPERLRAISEAASAKMDIKYREVLVVRCPMAQAVAFIGRRRLVFTDRLLELLSDDELAAICAHELAHLTESKWVRASRSIRFLTFWPWIFFKPIVHAFGTFGFFGLCLTTIFVPKIYRIDGCPVRVLRHPFRTLFKV